MVVDFESEHLTQEIEDWRNGAIVPYAASCARQIWYGTPGDFDKFPVKGNQPNLTFYFGEEAYAHLLKIVSGYESKRLGETHIRGQFYDGWRWLQQHHPEDAKRFQRIVGQLKKDANFIKNSISANFKEICEASAARDLSGQGKNSDVLVIAGFSRHGDVSDLTERMIRVSENLQKKRSGFIKATHPDMAGRLAISMKLMRDKKVIRGPVEVADFSGMAEAIEKADCVYVLTAMGENPKVDEKIVDAWSQRIRQDNVLVHLRGNPQKRGKSSGAWTKVVSEGYISPEQVREELSLRRVHNEKTVENAIKAFAECARLRNMGRLPQNVLPKERPELFV